MAASDLVFCSQLQAQGPWNEHVPRLFPVLLGSGQVTPQGADTAQQTDPHNFVKVQESPF